MPDRDPNNAENARPSKQSAPSDPRETRASKPPDPPDQTPGTGGSRTTAVPRNAVPPVATRIPKTDVVHGETRVDDYFWIREKTRPEVAAYLEAENAYADAVMSGTEELQERLYREMLGHIKETDVSAPYPDHGWLYYQRTEEGKQYSIRCRRRKAEGYPEEITLDLNELGKGLEFIAIGVHTVSHDGNLLAYSLDVTGFRQYTLFIKDLRTGEVLPYRAEKTGSVAWAADNRTLFYTVEDEAKRHYRVYRHQLGAAQDQLIYEEADERFSVGVGRSRSRAFLFIESGSHTASEWRYLPAGTPEGEWKLVAPREPEHEYEVAHHGAHFYIRTNSGGRNFRLVRAPAADPVPTNWQEILPHRPETMLEGMDFFRDHFVLHEREGGLPRSRVTHIPTGAWHRIDFPEPAYSLGPAENAEFDTTTYRFGYQSLVTPLSFFDYDMETRERRLVKETEVPGYDRSLYVSERIHATAPDGVQVPISLVRRKDAHTGIGLGVRSTEGTERDGPNTGAGPGPGSADRAGPASGTGDRVGSGAAAQPGPAAGIPGSDGSGPRPLHLVGYGSYGYPLPIFFSSNRLSLLDRGITVAIAHIRGGGEMGKPWHDAGRMMQKRNTFTDFIAVAEHLIARGDTTPDQLIIEGGSAGGLLMGAVTNLRPELFRAVISKVPFVDVINTMLDESLPLTVGEFEEWGNPKIREEYAYMRSYCPYSNLRAAAYPAMLVKTSFNDSQVMYWEPAKYVARIRTLKTGAAPLILKTNMAAGHGGASGRYDYLREVAFDYAFIFRILGLED